jgi:hypothetical protein
MERESREEKKHFVFCFKKINKVNFTKQKDIWYTLAALELLILKWDVTLSTLKSEAQGLVSGSSDKSAFLASVRP